MQISNSVAVTAAFGHLYTQFLLSFLWHSDTKIRNLKKSYTEKSPATKATINARVSARTG